MIILPKKIWPPTFKVAGKEDHIKSGISPRVTLSPLGTQKSQRLQEVRESNRTENRRTATLAHF